MDIISEISTPNPVSGRAQANKTGSVLELFIKRLLEDNGYISSTSKIQLFDKRKTITDKQYSTQVSCGTSIYESPRKCDFLVMNSKKFPEGLIIECKWQQSAGSVDEKYPFTLFNIMKIGVPTIIILDGNGYKKTAMQWLKGQVKENKVLIGVYNMSEFQALVNKGFLD